MPVPVRIYYQKCHQCGCTWATQFSPNTEVIRIGPEIYRCNCGIEWESGRVEWSHLSDKQRKSYFFSSAEIGVMLISTFVPPFFMVFISGRMAAYRALLGGFIFGCAFVLVLWTMKAAIVKWSLRRCPHTPGMAPSGGWPWNW